MIFAVQILSFNRTIFVLSPNLSYTAPISALSNSSVTSVTYILNACSVCKETSFAAITAFSLTFSFSISTLVIWKVLKLQKTLSSTVSSCFFLVFVYTLFQKRIILGIFFRILSSHFCNICFNKSIIRYLVTTVNRIRNIYLHLCSKVTF